MNRGVRPPVLTGPHAHTSTSDLAGLWDTGTLVSGAAPVAVAFPSRRYLRVPLPYPPFMHGKVRVPIKASPANGGTSAIFTITLASAFRAGYSFDVQEKAEPSGLWKTWKTAVTSLSVTFHHASAGSWRSRSRLHKNGSSAPSGWSPPKMITIS